MWHLDRMVAIGNKNTFVHPFFIQGSKALLSKMSPHVKLALSKVFSFQLCKAGNSAHIQSALSPSLNFDHLFENSKPQSIISATIFTVFNETADRLARAEEKIQLGYNEKDNFQEYAAVISDRHFHF